MVNSNAYQQNALEEFFHFSAIDQDRRKDAFNKGKAKGRSEGLAEGAYQKACETAKKFREIGIPIDQIAMGTGLSEEEILAL